MIVFFDLDSVLADFEKGVHELCHVDTSDQNADDKARDDAMWAAIRDTAHFYDRLELMPGAKELFRLAFDALGDDCQILSAVPRPKRGIVTAGADKTNWVHRLLSPDVTVNIVLKEEKKNFCKGADCILIDDLAANIEDWACAGGTGILHTDAESSMARLKELFERYAT